MTTVVLRKQVINKVTKADPRLLKLVNALMDEYEDSDSDESNLTIAQKKELDKRLKLHAEGKVKYYTFSEAKKMIISKRKKS